MGSVRWPPRNRTLSGFLRRSELIWVKKRSQEIPGPPDDEADQGCAAGWELREQGPTRFSCSLEIESLLGVALGSIPSITKYQKIEKVGEGAGVERWQELGRRQERKIRPGEMRM